MNITLTVTIFHKLILWSILWRSHMFSSYVFCRSLLKPIWQLYSVICFVSLYLFPNFLATRLSVASLRGWCPYTELGLGRRSPAPVSSDPGSESGGHCHRLFYLVCCSDILAPILFDFCISLITQNLERNNEENSHILYFEHFSDHSPGILTPNQWSLFRI